MKGLVASITAGLMLLGSQQASATVSLETSVCSNIGLGLGAALDTAADFYGEIEGGAGWGMGFAGKATTTLVGGGAVGANLGSTTTLSIESCVNASDLIELYRENLLTPEQRRVVLLYLGSAAYDDDQAEAAISALLTTAAPFLSVQRTESVYRPAATAIDTMVRSMKGEISGIKRLDQTIYMMKGMSDSMPMEPHLASWLSNFDTFAKDQLVAVTEAGEDMCSTFANELPGSGGDALDKICTSIDTLVSAGETLPQNLRGIVSVVGTVQGQVEKVDVVLDGAVKATEAVDSSLAGVIGELDNAVSLVGERSRDVVRMSGNVNQSLSTLTSSMDNVASAANSAIAQTASAIAAPLQVLTNLSGDVIDSIISTLGTVNTTLEGLVGDLEN